MLLRFCYKMEYGDRMPIVSLGQGQGPTAERLIKIGCENGDWVLLDEINLAPADVPRPRSRQSFQRGGPSR